MKIIAVWGHKFRPWGYEVRVDLQDDSDQFHCEVLIFPVKDEKDVPDKETIAKAVDKLAVQVEERRVAQLAELAEEPARKAQITNEDFMAAVSAGLIKADDAIIALQSYVTKR